MGQTARTAKRGDRAARWADGSVGPGRAVGAGSLLVLALLVCACVFAALTGPAVSLRTRSQALRQTLAATSPITRTVQADSPWDEFTSYMNTSNSGYLGLGQSENLTPPSSPRLSARSARAWPGSRSRSPRAPGAGWSATC